MAKAMQLHSPPPSPHASGARLTIEGVHPEVVSLEKRLTTIGRLPTSDVFIAGDGVSRIHARIEREGSDYVLRDCGSSCGTYVNGRRVVECVLSSGDRIGLGRVSGAQLTFRDGLASSPVTRSGSDGIDFTQMAAVLDILKAIGAGRMLDEVLTLVIDAALATTKAERGFIMLLDLEGELRVRTARAAGGIDLNGTSYTTSRKIPREVSQSGQTSVVLDLNGTPLDERHEESLRAGIRHVVCVPLRVVPPPSNAGTSRARIIGVLYLDGSAARGIVPHATVAALETLATQAALAIESARLYDEAAKKALIERDLRLAADIQRALLPAPECEGGFFEIAAAARPSRTVGGDFYDYLVLDDGRVGFTLGDVAGKGPSAALLAVAVLNNFAALAPVCGNPAELLSRINGALLRRAVEARFATMFYGVTAPDGVLRYCNAGQEPPAVVRGDRLDWLETGGIVLGLFGSATYEAGTVRLDPGDLVVLFSDGITEARNTAGEEFGRDRLVTVLERCRGGSASACLDAILREIQQFSADALQYDDITVLVFRYDRPA